MAPRIEKIFNQRKITDNKLELREYGVGAQILLEIGLNKIILLSNSNKKIIALDGFDLEIVSQEKSNMKRKILIVKATYYKEISNDLLNGVINYLKNLKKIIQIILILKLILLMHLDVLKFLL